MFATGLLLWRIAPLGRFGVRTNAGQKATFREKGISRPIGADIQTRRAPQAGRARRDLCRVEPFRKAPSSHSRSGPRPENSWRDWRNTHQELRGRHVSVRPTSPLRAWRVLCEAFLTFQFVMSKSPR